MFANIRLHMKGYNFLFILIIGFAFAVGIAGSTGCAQIGAPTGGPRDSIPPRLVNSTPPINSVSFSGNRISLTFNEYIEVRDVQNNVLVSPYQKTTPVVEFKLKTVTIKLKDSLLPNTTYAIDFGNAIVDNNEGNPLKNFTYVFSTGKQIDSLELDGRLIMAESGGNDSTLIVLLYKNAVDSSVQKNKPDYIARVNGKGNFNFSYLPAGRYWVYALKDGDGSKTYNSKVETFAFADGPVMVSVNTKPVTLYAYAESKGNKTVPKLNVKPNPADKKLKYTASVFGQSQDLKTPLTLEFNKVLKIFDKTKMVLTDTNYKAIPGVTMTLDSTRKKISYSMAWQPETKYLLVINSAAVSDSADLVLAKSDTLHIITKREADYGKLVLRFSNIDLAKHPVVQFVQGDEVKESFPITAMEWKNDRFNPGDYELRILFDSNQNGKWDPGNYSRKQQPEVVIQLTQKLNIRADWENEREIKL